ncbi:MAG TPA: PepSY domain-containing protein [Burkholderiales bacterium]
MHIRFGITCSALILALAIPPAAGAAGGRPPKDAPPLSSILQQLEQQGYAPIVDVDYDNGQWEMEAYRDGRKREIKVDAMSGKVLSERADD